MYAVCIALAYANVVGCLCSVYVCSIALAYANVRPSCGQLRNSVVKFVKRSLHSLFVHFVAPLFKCVQYSAPVPACQQLLQKSFIQWDIQHCGDLQRPIPLYARTALWGFTVY